MQLSTFALTLFRKEVELEDDDGKKTLVKVGAVATQWWSGSTGTT